MSLFEIKNKLYKKEEQKKEQASLVDFEYSKSMDGIAREAKQAEDGWKPEQKKISKKTRRIIKIGAIIFGGIILVAAGFWGVYKFRQSAFANERISVSVSGPSEVRSGQEINCEITWKNDNRIDLESAVLKLNYPENFKPENLAGFVSQGPTSGIVELGKIKGHSGSKFSFSGKAYSPKGALIYIQAELIYTASNFNSRFTAQNRQSIAITSSPIVLDVSYPQAVSNGDEINYKITYSNSGEKSFSNVNLKVDYPEGFEFISSDPVVSESNNQWYIGDLNSGGLGHLFIKGKLNGERNEVKELKISISSFENGSLVVLNEENAEVKIAASPLYISQNINKSNELTTNAGDFLKFKIFYRNDGDVGLRDVIISEKLIGDALNFSTLNLSGGSYNSETHTITWKAVDYPELKNLGPGESGTIEFAIRMKDPLPVNNENNKNFIISSLAKIDSPDIPTPIAMNKIISSNSINIKVNSQLSLSALGYYNDSTIPNSGPIPPRIGQETTYTIHWKVSNASNDLEEAKVEASLPTGVSITNKISPESENLKYNERTNLITWEIGKIEAGVGIIKPAKEIAFQIKIKPSIDQLREILEILGKSTFSGKDIFTLQDLKIEARKKDIFLEEDKKIGTNEGRVTN